MLYQLIILTCQTNKERLIKLIFLVILTTNKLRSKDKPMQAYVLYWFTRS